MSDRDHSVCAIRRFPEFLEKCLGRTVLDYTLKPLTKPGDHYGSILQAVEVKVAKNTNSNEVNLIFRSNF